MAYLHMVDIRKIINLKQKYIYKIRNNKCNYVWMGMTRIFRKGQQKYLGNVSGNLKKRLCEHTFFFAALYLIIVWQKLGINVCLIKREYILFRWKYRESTGILEICVNNFTPSFTFVCEVFTCQMLIRLFFYK